MLELPVLPFRIEKGTQAYTCAVSCKAGCCNYLSLPIDTPRSDRDFDDVRWYLMHEDTHVYKHEGDWYLLVLRKCRHLRDDKLCGIYDRRPAICAEYDPADCEFTAKVAYDFYFENDAQLETWLEKRKAERKQRAARAARTRARASKSRASRR